MSMVAKKIMVVLIFSIAMAALEAAVVVYLRSLYYHNGFTVAMKVMDEHILFVELIRELATIVMLICVAFLSSTNKMKRFAYFIFSFAVWDIFYYVWLKVFIDWPASIFDWDILFLIPITWLGPVIAPIICSLTMIALALLIIKANKIGFSFYKWCLLLAGCGCILFTFMQDYARILIDNDLIEEYPRLLHN